MTPDFAILKTLYNTFEPFTPLPAGDPMYVDCKSVRGDQDILVDLAREILLSNRITCQLYGGHRGAGKSTELLRLKQHLEEQNYFVVYFGADEEDIDPEDTQYTDILLACTRHLLESLKDSANPAPLLKWLQSRWEDLKDLALTEISFEELSVELQITQFAKLTSNLRAEPGQRQKIRERVNPHTITLIQALNTFIKEAQKYLQLTGSQLLVIADNLDRIVPTIQEDGRTNLDHIFIDRNEQLKALNCHLIYTIPISMLYSNRAADLLNIYGDAQILPMIMVRKLDDSLYQPGLDKLKEIIAKRIYQVNPNFNPEKDVFANGDILTDLCLMSGGHVRDLMHLIRYAIKRTDSLPISVKAVQRSIQEMRDVYHRSVNADQWSILAKASSSKQLENEDGHRSLLFIRCLLEYRYFDESGTMKRWCNVHPLIKDIPDFKQALTSL